MRNLAVKFLDEEAKLSAMDYKNELGTAYLENEKQSLEGSRC
jgi:hypothetical protein